MKTVFINCSPKKKWSASGFIINFTSLFVAGEKEKVQLRAKPDYQKILEMVQDADNVVFAMPLYVDGVPSHVLPFLKVMEEYCIEKERKPRIYVIANNGFIEGKQNEPLMQVMENFSARSGLPWCGGLGIGGGVMMNVMRIMVMVYFGIMLLNIFFTGVREGSFFQMDPIIEFGKQLLVVLILGCGIISLVLGMTVCMNRGRAFGKHYTRIMLPSFVFIICADIFFTVISVFCGGIFRGWLSRKKPSA